jgi:hypothetical protein
LGAAVLAWGAQGSPPPLTQALPGVAARAEDARLRRQRLAAQDERLGVVGRELTGAHGVGLVVPARTDPAVDGDVGLDGP